MSEDFFEDIKKPRITKVRTSFNVDYEVLNEFNKIAKSKNYNKSQIINNFLKKFLGQEKSLLK